MKRKKIIKPLPGNSKVVSKNKAQTDKKTIQHKVSLWKRFRFNTTRAKKKMAFFGVLLGFGFWFFWGIPLPTELSTNQVPVSTKLFDRNDELIYEIYADKRSTPVKVSELPDYVKNATIAIEDKDFYHHYGYSYTGIVRAAYKTVFKGKLQGGSTLTQQLVKNALLTPERTIRRKLREFVLTIFVEAIYSKDKILELYLNQIPYGGTAYGIGAAAETYFGKSAKDLSLAEASLLAGLPQAPSRYSPFGSHPELATGRQKLVLQRMVEDGYISQEDADKALDEELKFSEQDKLKAPHFALWVKEQLAEEYGEAIVERGGLRVKTTLDLQLQEFAEQKVATEVADLKDNNVGNGAALVTRPSTGEILAMVGSYDYFAEDEDGKVNIIFSQRQPGSSIKPLNYALAIKDKKITASTPLADIPTCFQVVGQAVYCPKNYDGNFRGAVQVRFALGNSLNIPAVRVLALNGINNFIDFATEMGITTFTDPSDYGLSLTLGGGEVRPYDMAEVFGVFANSGIRQPLIGILKVEDWKGKVLQEVDTKETALSGKRIFSQGVAFIISHILQDNNARSEAFGTSSFLNVSGHPEVSVKTGTTNDLRDNWTIGYTRYAVVVVWVGNNDNSEMSRAISGVSGASPIWNAIMGEVLNKAEDGVYSSDDDGHAWPQQPDDVIGMSVCTDTGVIPSGPDDNPGCPTRFEYFLENSTPLTIKGGFQDVHYDRTTGGFINENTLSENIEVRQQHVLYDPLDTFICLDCTIPASSQSATIKYPLTIINSGVGNTEE